MIKMGTFLTPLGFLKHVSGASRQSRLRREVVKQENVHSLALHGLRTLLNLALAVVLLCVTRVG